MLFFLEEQTPMTSPSGLGHPMTWTVETLGAVVDAEITALPKDMQAAFLRLAERVEAVGLERIGQPHVRHLQDKLWEMRFGGRDGIGRAIYVTGARRRIIVVHAFMKKTRKTPRAALELAERRAKEIRP
jgi:phage-related protein